jgi:DeoR family transcriptional regulator of aga operon/DeoR family fructose operon transcriptional repressor
MKEMQHERRNNIVARLKAEKTVKVTDLVKEYDVSIETIRKDLEYLEKQGFLARVYGGATLQGFHDHEEDYARRQISNLECKKAIAQKAASLVPDKCTLFLDIGTTTMEVARALRRKTGLTVITNSLPAAIEISENCKDSRVILLGGELRRGELAVSGAIADEITNRFFAAKAIVGVGGIIPDEGVTDYHFLEASTRRLMMQRSDEVIAVADHTKFGVRATNYICPANALSAVITDWMLPANLLEEYRSKGLNIITAEEE